MSSSQNIKFLLLRGSRSWINFCISVMCPRYLVYLVYCYYAGILYIKQCLVTYRPAYHGLGYTVQMPRTAVFIAHDGIQIYNILYF